MYPSDIDFYALIGIRYATRYDEYSEEIVALFTSKAKAQEYLEYSKLKNPRCNHIFRNSSLLTVYDTAEIELFSGYLIDPEIK